MMSGINTIVAQNMMPSVRRLDTLSQTVRLAAGIELDGMMNGNIDAPAVPITPTTASDEAMNALSVKRMRISSAARSAPATPSAGSTQSKGCLP